MSGLGKLLLILGLVAVGGLALIGGGAWYWWKHYGTEMLEAGAATLEDGRKSGEQLQEAACVSLAVDRHKSGPGLASTVRNSLWLSGCLDTSRPQADFCDGVPNEANPLAVGTWTAGACVQRGLADPYCSSLLQAVAKYCSSGARSEKLKKRPPSGNPPPLPTT